MKKGQGLPLNTIIIAVLVIVVAVVIIFLFRNYIQKEADVIDAQLTSFDDCDCDGVSDFLDECDFDATKFKLDGPNDKCGSTGTSVADCLKFKDSTTKKCKISLK